MRMAAALATGLPLLVGAAFGRLDYGLVSSLGLAFLHLPETPMHHRRARPMACAFGLSACHAPCMASHALPMRIRNRSGPG
jgi:hypothetical protein